MKEDILLTAVLPECVHKLLWHVFTYGRPGSSLVKNLIAQAGDTDSIPGPGRSPGEENGNPP